MRPPNVLPDGLAVYTSQRPGPGFNAVEPALLAKLVPEITRSWNELVVTELPELRVTPPLAPASSWTVPALKAPLTVRFPLPSVVTEFPVDVEKLPALTTMVLVSAFNNAAPLVLNEPPLPTEI